RRADRGRLQPGPNTAGRAELLAPGGFRAPARASPAAQGAQAPAGALSGVASSQSGRGGLGQRCALQPGPRCRAHRRRHLAGARAPPAPGSSEHAGSAQRAHAARRQLRAVARLSMAAAALRSATAMSTPQNPLPPSPIGLRDAENRDAGGSEAPHTLPPTSGAQPTHVPRANASPASGRESGPAPRSSRGGPPASAGPGLDPPGGPLPVVAFEDERPASEQLGGARSDWERRAEWLESEAKSHPDAATRNRLLLAASEVRAL